MAEENTKKALVTLRTSAGDFDPGAQLAVLEALGGGAVASFTGIVRKTDGLAALHLEHYPAMTQAQMDRIAREAVERWPLLGITLIHRIGTIPIGARIVFVGVASRHRAEGLEACAYLIDWLKVSAPFWKREIRTDGSGGWVDAKPDDDARAAQWLQRRSE